MSGLPCGPKAALATKGYFPKQRNRRGRQLGRVLASRYGEIVTDQLFTGRTLLVKALMPLLEAAEQALTLDAAKRARTIVRLDSGGGSIADINWLLEHGYQVQTKDYSRARARKLGQGVTAWVDDPQIAGRQVGWVPDASPAYVRDLRRIAVRWPHANGQWEYAVVRSSLTAEEVLAEVGLPSTRLQDAAAVLVAYVRFYDARGGGVETSFKDDKPGLGVTKRSKKRPAAQQMLTLLGTLAHNVVVWARGWLAPQEPQVRRYGMQRMVRDVFHISGFLLQNSQGHIVGIVLNLRAPLVRGLTQGLAQLVRPAHMVVNWGQT